MQPQECLLRVGEELEKPGKQVAAQTPRDQYAAPVQG